MSILRRSLRPVKPTRHSPRPSTPFGAGLDVPCGCTYLYTCPSCLERQHAERRARVSLDERYGPTEAELRWHAENSNLAAIDYDILDVDADDDLKTAARWSEFCNAAPDDEGDWR